MAPTLVSKAMPNNPTKRPTPEDLERIREFQLSMARTAREASFAMERLTRALTAGAAAFQKAFEKEINRKRKVRNNPNV
jgi:hypothetical protein